MYVRIITTNDRMFVSHFAKLANLSRYLRDCLRNGKPFNVWTTTNGTHPVSGEPVVLRERIMLNPAAIASVEQVEANADGAWVPVKKMVEGEYGLWTAPNGTVFPVHRDESDLRRYVFTAPEVKHYLDDIVEIVSDSEDNYVGDEDA